MNKVRECIQNNKQKQRMKEDDKLINYLTDIILRPHRQIYSIQKLGPSKIVVKSHQKSIFVLKSMSKNEKNLPKQIQTNYCELIEVNRREVTIMSQGKSIQASIYQPQLTKTQNINTHSEQRINQQTLKNHKPFIPGQVKIKSQPKYQNCVIFLHANSGSRIQGTLISYEAMQYAKYVLQYRTLCVSFDYSGSGVSQGQYSTMGVNESKDLSSVIHYIAQKYQLKRFSLWGRSMGAVTGIYYLLTKYKQDVKKIRITSCVIDSPFSNLQQLILEIASRKSILPQMLFKPILKPIQNDIVSKIGVNIFSQLNLIEKIRSLTQPETKLINSVSFLGLASKEDTMINYQHCQQLCQLLIPRDVRNSDLIDDSNQINNNNSDKHLMMLVQFKKDINTKGDFIQIEGDHNKPRANEVKEKISFFIQDNFYSYKDRQTTILPFIQLRQQSKQVSFTKTGMSIKTKLSFAKSGQNGTLKVRKDSTNVSNLMTEQNKMLQSIPRHNYNLINLKDISAKQFKQSLSKEKESIRNSLSKSLLPREKKDLSSVVQNPKAVDHFKGLNVVSKEFQKDRIKSTDETCKVSKKAYQTLQNYKHYHPNQNQQASFQNQLSFANIMNKGKELHNTPKYTINQITGKTQNNSNNSGSVNNSITKDKSFNSTHNNDTFVTVSSLELPQNNIVLEAQQNRTQRDARPQKMFQSQPSERMERNFQTQVCVYQSKLELSPEVNTTPFNLSSENRSNISMEVPNSVEDKKIRKRSQIFGAEDSSIKKQTPNTPQMKISISQFQSRHQEVSSINKKIYPLLRKENNLTKTNTTNLSNFNDNNNKGFEVKPLNEDTFLNKNSIQFKKRSPGKTTSIHSSIISHEGSLDQMRLQSNSYLDVGRQQQNNRIAGNRGNYYKPQNMSSSFSQNTPSFMSQMIINENKGMTQSSTFTYSNCNNQIYYSFNGHPEGQQRFVQYVNHNANPQYMMTSSQRQLPTSNGYYPVNGQNRTAINTVKSMKSSQNQYVQDPNIIMQNNKVKMSGFQSNTNVQNNKQPQNPSYSVNSTNNNFYYPPQQGPKQTIVYKKRINGLFVE